MWAGKITMVIDQKVEGGMHRGGGRMGPRARGIPHLAQRWQILPFGEKGKSQGPERE